MTPGARVAAAITILDEIAAGAPAEQALTRWARASRFAGSGDRSAVRSHVFDVLRRWRSTAAQGGRETGRARMIGLLTQEGADLAALFSGAGHATVPLTDAERRASSQPISPEDARDLPDWLWPLFEDSLGDGALDAAEALRHRAPIFLRVNLSRTPREDLAARLAQNGIDTAPCPQSPAALRVLSGERRLRQTPDFQDGAFEFQDLSSQRAAALVPLPDGDLMDFCAGGGGKALALADRARTDGTNTRIFVHDANPARMADLTLRAKRAGVSLTVLSTAEAEGRTFDSVLLDVPCTGSGTWRRQPQAKWQLTPSALQEAQRLQHALLRQGQALCRPGGTLVYMTCSVFGPENTQQIEGFLAQSGATRQAPDFVCPISEDGDGFYASVLKCQ